MPSGSKKNFYQRFSVHAVGQGFFYSGLVESGSNTFKFAFDCGSYNTPAILREIDTFENELLKGGDELDLLVISHFDEDHVNHISDLLLKVKKVKRLVLPFLNFEERLYLLMRIYERRTGRGSRGPTGVSAELVRLILDPIGFLSNYLDGDSEVYLIEDDNGPVRPTKDNLVALEPDRESRSRRKNENVQSRSGSTFEMRPRIELGNADLKAMMLAETGAAMFSILDVSRGTMRIRDKSLMEFIFYKRALDHSEADFYRLVTEEFKKVYKIGDLELDTVLEKLKEIKSATKIKKIFSEVAKECGLPITETANLNTTALCMLHKNLEVPTKNIKVQMERVFDREDYDLESSYFYYFPKSIETRYHFERHSFVYKQYRDYVDSWSSKYLVYPNTLLTSDSFIKKRSDHDKFFSKFKPYLSEIWLIQVPHHGSEKNITSDFINNSDFQQHMSFFINYGIQNRSGHPNKLVLEWLQNVEEYSGLHLVNEWQGLTFDFKSEIRE